MNKVKYAIAWPFSWGLYWIGHGFSKIVESVDDLPFEDEWEDLPLWFRAAFGAYEKSMRLSCRISDWGGGVCWEPAKENRDE